MKYLLSVFFAIALVLSSNSNASNNRDVVQDERGNVVVNSFGNCVRTKWQSASDACAPSPAPRRVAEPMKPVKARSLSKEELSIYFDFNKSNINAESRRKLDRLADILKSDSEVKAAEIVGFADRIGSDDYNLKLSEKRANAVKNYLAKKNYFNTNVAEVRWLGETAPVTKCANNLKRAELINCLGQDRRVELEIQYYNN